MKTLIWRIRFAIAVSWIFRQFWWRNKKIYISLGWEISRTMKKDKDPYQTALDEITRWYYG